jgi:hypothetical protein
MPSVVPSNAPSSTPSTAPSSEPTFIIKAGNIDSNLCLQPAQLKADYKVKTRNCNGSDDQSWTKNQEGRFFNVADSSLCLKRIWGDNLLKVDDDCSSSPQVNSRHNFAFDWFDSKFVMKKNPGLVATISALQTNVFIEFKEWTADNVLQKFTIVPDNYVISAPPPNFFQIQSEIPGDYCLAPTSDGEVKPVLCSSTDTAQLWFYENGFFRSDISSSGPLCMIKDGGILKINSCVDLTDRFIYDFFHGNQIVSWLRLRTILWTLPL